MALAREERAYEKYAWILLLIVGIHGIVFAFGLISPPSFQSLGVLKHLGGMSWDQLVATSPSTASFIIYLSRQSGVFLLGASLVVIAIAAGGFRKGERWAWYAAWPVLAYHVGAVLNDLTVNDYPLVLATILALLALILPVRRFFPRKLMP